MSCVDLAWRHLTTFSFFLCSHFPLDFHAASALVNSVQWPLGPWLFPVLFFLSAVKITCSAARSTLAFCPSHHPHSEGLVQSSGQAACANLFCPLKIKIVNNLYLPWFSNSPRTQIMGESRTPCFLLQGPHSEITGTNASASGKGRCGTWGITCCLLKGSFRKWNCRISADALLTKFIVFSIRGGRKCSSLFTHKQKSWNVTEYL